MLMTSLFVIHVYQQDFSNRAIGIINFERLFTIFHRLYHKLVSKPKVGLLSLSYQGLSEPEFYGDLVYKFQKTV